MLTIFDALKMTSFMLSSMKNHWSQQQGKGVNIITIAKPVHLSSRNLFSLSIIWAGYNIINVGCVGVLYELLSNVNILSSKKDKWKHKI